MSGEVIDVADFRPHLCVMTADGDAHVIPAKLVTDVTAGFKPVNILGDAVLRQIVEEWFRHVMNQGVKS